MNNNWIFAVSTICLLHACGRGSGNANKQALTWRETNVVAKEQNCAAADCAFADFRFVVFTGAGADSLNRHIEEMMGSSYMDDSLIVTTPQLSAEKFITAFEDFKSEYPESAQRWMLDREIRPDTLLGNVITLRYDESSYSGGAHGLYFTIYNHFQLSPFRSMWLADFLSNPADTLAIATIAEEIFRNKQELGKDENLEEAGYFFTRGIFKLNENFHFTKSGLEFHFNIYEIQPYAAGELELLLPYERIAQFLKPEIFKTKPGA